MASVFFGADELIPEIREIRFRSNYYAASGFGDRKTNDLVFGQSSAAQMTQEILDAPMRFYS